MEGNSPALEHESLLKFPCEYPLKVMGIAGPSFERLAFEIVGRHVPDLEACEVERRASRSGKYISFTFRFTATSRGQLDDLYLDLNRCEAIAAIL